MKISYLMSVAVATLLLTGCGSSSTTSAVEQTVDTTQNTTITVERGPILGAKVIDINGEVANETAAGVYTFSLAPTYPILVTGGVIDMDRDGEISQGDVVNDINLSTVQGSVVTLLTTLAANVNTKAEIESLVNDLNLTQDDLYSKTPTDSQEIEAISNVIYRYVKENNLKNLLDTNETFNLSTSVQTEYSKYAQEAEHSAQQTEQDLVDALETKVEKLESDAEVTLKQEEADQTLSQDELAEIERHLLELKNEYELEYGDLEYEESGSLEAHNQGLSCAQCHSLGGTVSLSDEFEDSEEDDDENEYSEGYEDSEDSENAFTSGGTIFTVLNASNGTQNIANNYSLRLVLAQSGTEINYKTGRGSANANATFSAGVENYTAQVLNTEGFVVNSSVANSHDASRFDCNSCHTAAGTNGAPGRIVSFSYALTTTSTTITESNTTITTPTTDTNTSTTTVAVKSFATDVLPILDTNCKGCHGGSGSFSITSSTTPYAGVTPFVDTVSADTSSLLLKGSGVSHGGGVQLTATEFTTIRDWISQGAQNN